MKKLVFVISLFVAAFSASQAQEILVPLSGNPVLESARALWPDARLKSGGDTYLTLPFIDDFSEKGLVYPNQHKWSDTKAFINNSFGFDPPSLGVATLDVLDDTGNIYSNATFATFKADELTSHFIRLDSIFTGGPGNELSPADSIYFSFWYQPQGHGNAPEAGDILELQFLEAWHIDTIIDTINPPYDTTFVDVWNTVWFSEGMPLDHFRLKGKSLFEQVLIPIVDSIYFRKDFRFRFVNYGSLADNSLQSWQSNVDHWNIDYVILDAERSKHAVYQKDIALIKPAVSLLKTYDVLPYSQYSEDTARHMGHDMNVLIASLDSEIVNQTFDYMILDEGGTEVFSYDGGSFNLQPSYHDSVYQDYAQHADPPVYYTYPEGPGDSISFTTIQYITRAGSAGNIIRSNDTSVYEQKFRNYYALDDGTAEAGYGLTPSGSQLAYRFILDKPDTLTHIRFFFNRTANDVNQKYFYLTVWEDRDFRPGDILWTQEGIRPEFPGGLNRFHTYTVESEEPLIVADTFYVGWVQTTDDNLNVGFDRHRDAHKEIFFNTNNGTWFNSAYEGALMIRPVFGKYQTPDKINPGGEKNLIVVYPNPLEGNQLNFMLRETLPGIEEGNISIYDLTGRRVLESEWTEHLTIPSEIRSGVYLIQIRSDALDTPLTIRFIIP